MKKKIYNLSPKERCRVLEFLGDFFKDRKEVMFAYVYGSFVEDMPFSDIDVGVYISGILEEEATQYTLNLGQMLENDARYPIDIRVLNFAPVSFLYYVIKGRLVYERNDDLRVQVAERVILKYLDLKPMIKKGIKEAFVP
ncbi:MAG: nucleotidyltransferase [Candidatus Scalindua rubra]|uniref:Nucleotidyltransferase n=1 Tax=Candidatus Scalindua rubra TaxID=1872076 RepID=A0A1E3XCV6_9BACT|nr:MAG: nucleotidyltransferase [Candidatus Scalindua rubra]